MSNRTTTVGMDDDRAERSNALDQFAVATSDDRGGREIATAQAFGTVERNVGAQPVAVHRDIPKVMRDLKALAAAVGDAWYFRFPVKDKGATKFIEGPSIKLTNDLARLYGNCDVDCRVGGDTGKAWIMYARFTDIETGFSLTRPFIAHKGASKLGGSDQERKEMIAFQIGVSKAERNVVRNALQTFADFAFQEARGALVDKIGKRVDHYRENVSSRLKDMGGSQLLAAVEAIRGRPIAKFDAQDLARTIAEIQAINDGMADPDETWPTEAVAQRAAADAETVDETPASGSTIDQFADGGADAETADQPPKATGKKRAKKAGSKTVAKDDKKPADAEPVAPASDVSDAVPDLSGSDAVDPAGGEAGRPNNPPPETSAGSASDPDLTDEQRDALRKLSEELFGAESAGKLQRVSSAFWGDDQPEEGTAFGRAADAVYAAHYNRVTGGADDTIAAVKKAIG